MIMLQYDTVSSNASDTVSCHWCVVHTMMSYLVSVSSMTALHQAALVGNTGIMKMLLENDASVDIKDMKGGLLSVFFCLINLISVIKFFITDVACYNKIMPRCADVKRADMCIII